ncbi:glutathione S-transferase [Roseovarius aestuariivivens]|uniref:glutathione S-transferase n=1 Tax=Roseovarius aestuariivivens TaxID=1888910 RepID=UPI0010811C67|nr:glutathione S-transferase [Roseovarius aestuariivivens]
MKLLTAPPSPFGRKVKVVLIETGQLEETEIVDVTTTPMQTDPAVAAANPAGKIPALVREDGPALYDSRVICRYLDARSGAGLYPETRLWEVLTLEATADGILEAALTMVYELRFRPEEQVMPEWVEAQWARVKRSLDALEARWMAHLSGHIDAGHIAIGCALGYLDFRHGDRDWRDGHDDLARWYEAFAQRDSMEMTKPG